jgi:hypothetical protein
MHQSYDGQDENDDGYGAPMGIKEDGTPAFTAPPGRWQTVLILSSACDLQPISKLSIVASPSTSSSAFYPQASSTKMADQEYDDDLFADLYTDDAPATTAVKVQPKSDEPTKAEPEPTQTKQEAPQNDSNPYPDAAHRPEADMNTNGNEWSNGNEMHQSYDGQDENDDGYGAPMGIKEDG